MTADTFADALSARAGNEPGEERVGKGLRFTHALVFRAQKSTVGQARIEGSEAKGIIPILSPGMPPGAPRPNDVFLSHTSELGKYPEGRTFVDAALDAVRQAGFLAKEMRDFASEADPPAAVCERAVLRCQLLVCLIGLRYGSPVPDRPEISYAQLEFQTAVSAGLPILIFLLDEKVIGLPAEATRDSVYGQRQDEFRKRVLADSRLTCCTFKTPDELQHKLYQSLSQSRIRPPAAPMPVGGPAFAAALTRACREQVNNEIVTRVGRKYIRQLFRERPLEKDIHAFLAADLNRECIHDLGVVLLLLASKSNSEVAGSALRELEHSISQINSYQEALEKVRQAMNQLPDSLCRQIGTALDRLPRFLPSCFLVKDKAGSGKTNLLCRLAEGENPRSVCLVVTCKGILWNDATLGQLLGQMIRRNWPENGRTEALQQPAEPGDQEFFHAIARQLRESGRQLVVFLDGINENRDLGKLQQLLVRGFEGMRHYPVKFVVTCRDIFWSFFDSEQWEPFLFRRRTFELSGFSAGQMDEVIAAYFSHFEISGQIIGRAREQCQHPLLLRFFCEAYRGADIRQFEDLRLKDLFQKYWDRKKAEISDSLGLSKQGGQRVEHFLYRVGEYMLQHATTRMILRQVPDITGEADLDSPNSLYQRFLDEDIILEELPPGHAFDMSHAARRITFVYDEFYDYVMALAYVQKQDWDGKTLRAICEDFCELLSKLHSFEQLRGMAEYLVLLAEPRNYHRELCAVLARSGKHEILCSLLPKLRGEMDWAVDVMGCCLKVAGQLQAGPRGAGKKSQEYAGLFAGITVDLARKSDESKILKSLLIGARP